MNIAFGHFLPAALAFTLAPALAHAGIFAPEAGESGTTAVAASSPAFEGWAVAHENYSPGLEADAAWRTPDYALGVPGDSDGTNRGFVYDVVSLGRGGEITLRFSPPIADGEGFDFAVFENAINDTFLELARVEVSSDGEHFVPFPAFSLVPAAVSGYGGLDPTDVEQVASKYRGGYGMPFDLAQLTGAPLLDLSAVRYVRLTDIVGDGSAANDLTPATLADWLGVEESELPQSLVDTANSAPDVIYDPYPTYGSAGFDLDAVGVLRSAPAYAVLDIDPFDANNEVDPDSTGWLPVVVHSTSLDDGDLDNLDATDIDPDTVRFGVFEAAPVSGPFIDDFDGDGRPDAGYTFQVQDTGIACEDTSAPLTGETFGGVEFAGSDAVLTPECETGGCHP